MKDITEKSDSSNFDVAIEKSAPVLEEIAKEVMENPEIAMALDDQTIDESW